MPYSYSMIYLAPDGERNHVRTHPYEYPSPEVAMREAENNQPPERRTRWGSPTTKDVNRIEDWRFGWLSGPEYACAIAVHPSGMTPHLIGMIWHDLVQYEAAEREASLRKRRTLIASAAPQPKVYLSPEAGLHMVNQRRKAEGKPPYTWPQLKEISARQAQKRAEAVAREEYLQTLPPLPRTP